MNEDPNPQSAENYYAVINGNRQGPFSREALENHLKEGLVNLDTWVWEPSQPDWLPLAELLEIELPPPPDQVDPPAETVSSPPSRPAGSRAILFFLTGFVLGCLLTYVVTHTGRTIVKPELPVQVVFRGSLMDQSLVARFHSLAERPLSMKLRLLSQSGGRDLEAPLVLNPGEVKEIGWMEGWAFQSGDIIELNHQSFQSARHRAP